MIRESASIAGSSSHDAGVQGSCMLRMQGQRTIGSIGSESVLTNVGKCSPPASISSNEIDLAMSRDSLRRDTERSVAWGQQGTGQSMMHRLTREQAFHTWGLATCDS